jgi:5-histidylcysteine sulfoxide synthase/putative 4-mercaptohistidine N1-methyltranferase
MTYLLKQQATPLLTGKSSVEKRQELKQYFQNSWQTYESLFSLINNDEAYYLKPEPLRHPLIFYFGHTASFFINKLILGKYIDQRLNEKLEAICAVGVDEMSWDDLNSAHYDWPSVDEVRAYRQQVFTLVNNLIETMELSLPIKQDSLAWVILMGCEHERIHLETSSVIMRLLDVEYLNTHSDWQACQHSGPAPKNDFLPIKGALSVLGKDKADMTFGWDNEYGTTEVNVNDFSVSKYLITNQEFLVFVEDGGYQQPCYWNEEGKKWLSYSQAKMPRFWFKNANGQGYVQRNLVAKMPLPLNWPVEVNYLEAKAYCQWQSEKTKSSIRLLTEPEWYVLYDSVYGKSQPNDHQLTINHNLDHFSSSCPVDSFNQQEFFDVCGNVWQWSESTIDGFNGFKVHPLYDDFSTPTFDQRHNLIKGGSWISTGNEILKSARYAFRRHFTQHAGFRTVQSNESILPLAESINYENRVDVCQQLNNHYGELDPLHAALCMQGKKEGGYLTQLANYIKKVSFDHKIARTKILNLGCSVGRCSFELASDFDHVDAVDFSASYLQYGVQLQQGKNVRYVTENQGEIVRYNEVSLATVNHDNDAIRKYADKVFFSQGDISNLKDVFTGYDIVFVQHALEQSYHPLAFLKTINERLNKGGLLIIASNYHFDENITEKSKWLSGIKVNGENVIGIDGLTAALSKQFLLVGQQEFICIETTNQRNAKLSNTEVSVWKLKE